MSITVCPHCKMRIIPKQDGTCPSCFAVLTQEEMAGPPRPSGILPKKGPKTAGRKKASVAKRTAADLPSSARVSNTEHLYWDYRQTAEDVWKGSLRAAFPYHLCGLLIGFASFALSFLTWERVYIGSQRTPSSASWIFLWLGVISIFVFLLIGIFKANQWSHSKIRDLVHIRPGFQEFYKSFLRRNWPKDALAAAPKLDQFLAIIGKS
jgi:hypothetical protein